MIRWTNSPTNAKRPPVGLRSARKSIRWIDFSGAGAAAQRSGAARRKRRAGALFWGESSMAASAISVPTADLAMPHAMRANSPGVRRSLSPKEDLPLKLSSNTPFRRRAVQARLRISGLSSGLHTTLPAHRIEGVGGEFARPPPPPQIRTTIPSDSDWREARQAGMAPASRPARTTAPSSARSRPEGGAMARWRPKRASTSGWATISPA